MMPNSPSRPTGESEVPRPLIFMLVGATLLLAYLVWPVRVPLFLAIVSAVVSRPVFFWLTKILGGRRRVAGALLTLMLLAGIVLPITALGAAMFREMADGIGWLRDSLGMPPEQHAGASELIARASEEVADMLHVSRDELRRYMSDAAHIMQRAAPQVVGASLSMLGQTFLLLVAFYFLTVDGHWLKSFIGRISPLRPEQTHELLIEFRNVTSGAVLGNAVNSVLQSIIVTAGFLVVGIPHAIFFGLLTVPAALIPLVGSQLIWLPAVIALVWQTQTTAAIGLAVWCQVSVLIIDNFVKPRILRGKVEFHAGLLLLGFVGGLAMFGLPGLVAGPLVVVFALTLYRIYQRDYLNHGIVLRANHNS